MKQILLLIAAIIISAGSFAQELVNGGFENWDDNTTPTGWDKVENITQESSIKRSGMYSAKHTGGTKDLGQFIDVTAGKSYDISLWYYGTGGDGTDARIWSYWKDINGDNIDDDGTNNSLRGPGGNCGSCYLPTEALWKEYSTTVIAPANATQLYFEVRTYSGAVTYFDDIVVKESTTTDISKFNANQVGIYPNPFTNQLTISAESIESVDILNSVGQRVLIAKGNNSGEVVVPTAEFTNGIYIVKITKADGTVTTKKVMKK